MPEVLIDLEWSFRGSPIEPTVVVSMRDQQSADFKELATATVSIRIADLLAQSNDALGYGQALAAMLFAAQPIQASWDRVVGYTAGAAATMRLRLRFEPGTEVLQALRWECLCDPEGVPVIAEG
ncbi:MAG: hypothetical protein HC828_10740 [Blastochloris sp.]|nr:hypothetical protein [Blastochloris sp.]